MSTTVFWMIVLALASLLWAAPVGVESFRAVAPATQFYYGALLAGGIALLACAALLLYRRKLDRRVMVAGFVAALGLGINQATGLALNSILCFSPG